MLELRDFYFIRHGETDWNREHRGMGQKDIPLNERGLEQAHQAATVLAKEPIQTICFSPLMRARVTAEIIGEKLNVSLIAIPNLVECGSRQTGSEAADGSQCNTWSNLGIRANYYFDFADSGHLIYVGPGLLGWRF